jgi:gluconolactonase
MTHLQRKDTMSRRALIQALAAGTGAMAAGLGGAAAETGAAAPPSTVTNPPRDFGRRGAPTTYLWDLDLVAVEPEFNSIVQANTAIKRLYTGLLWGEGPAWSARGRYLVWSDIPKNRQMRWSGTTVTPVCSAIRQITAMATHSTSRRRAHGSGAASDGLPLPV